MGTFTRSLEWFHHLNISTPDGVDVTQGRVYHDQWGYKEMGLIKFANHSDIDFSTISKIELHVNLVNSYTTANTYFQFYKVLRACVSPTWNKYDSVSNLAWNAAGCLGAADTDISQDLIVGDVAVVSQFSGWIDIELDIAKFISLQSSTRTIAMFYRDAFGIAVYSTMAAAGAYVKFTYNGSLSGQCGYTLF